MGRLPTMLAAVALALPAAAAGDAAAGRAGFGICEACHGVQAEGNHELGAPRIAGIEGWYLQEQYAAFRSGWRGAAAADERGGQMRSIVHAVEMTGAGLADIGAFLAELAPPPGPATVDGDADRGRGIYVSCVPCHGAQAGGSRELGAPALRLREDWYLLRQLTGFRAGWRGTAAEDVRGALMRAQALALADERALRDVVAYVRTLP